MIREQSILPANESIRSLSPYSNTHETGLPRTLLSDLTNTIARCDSYKAIKRSSSVPFFLKVNSIDFLNKFQSHE